MQNGFHIPCSLVFINQQNEAAQAQSVWIVFLSSICSVSFMLRLAIYLVD